MSGHKSEWGWPTKARKAHVFFEGRSLCGRWAFFGRMLGPFSVTSEPGPDDCRECWRKAIAQDPRSTKAEQVINDD